VKTSTRVHIPVDGVTVEGMLEIPERAVGRVLFESPGYILGWPPCAYSRSYFSWHAMQRLAAG
jgi:hypothetical protein